MNNHGQEVLDTLKVFGADPAGVVFLDGPASPEQLDYLDLKGSSNEQPPIVDAVVSMAGRPTLYAVRGPYEKNKRERLCHILSQRGSADYLAVIEPGVLTLFPVVQKGKKKIKPQKWEESDSSAPTRIPSLAFGIEGVAGSSAAKALHDNLVVLLNSTTYSITGFGVSEQDALSLVGRALFLRFLLDRKILRSENLKAVCPEAPSILLVMSRPEWVTATGFWLEQTFNGDLLPLSKNGVDFWNEVSNPRKVCDELSKILYKTTPTGQLNFDWDTLDFSHIPVGLLSQVYEAWCHEFTPNVAKRDSVWYTPRTIAEYMVSEAFFELPNKHQAKVLDPAVGAGVFLVAAYRELILALWRHEKKRPNRESLRQILYYQLVGFDINEGALRLTALSLYLTALEFDPNPYPITELRFKNLREQGVLHDVQNTSQIKAKTEQLSPIGSLGDHISSKHNAIYDVVVGNPPWTSWSSERNKTNKAYLLEQRKKVENIVTKILRNKLPINNINFEMVDNNPDIAFFFRALEWAKPNGVIALVLHARLLFRTTEAAIRLRSQFFRAATTTGILNGAALAQTSVWPHQEAPFCLWFAINRKPQEDEGFYFISPVIDNTLNSQGHIRIDPSAGKTVFVSQVEKNPWLLKTLFRGTNLDISIMERISSFTTSFSQSRNIFEVTEKTTVKTYWQSRKLKKGLGYKLGGENSSKKTAPDLESFPDLKKLKTVNLLIKTDKLNKFGNKRVHTVGKKELFEAPLVLVFTAPRHDRKVARALVSWNSLTFTQSFHGFSTSKHNQAKLLARYLFVILNSNLSLYLILLRGSTFGVSRKRLDHMDLLDIPFLPIENLSKNQKENLVTITEQAFTSNELPQDQIDNFIAETLGLSSWDMQVIKDTLDISLPFKSSISKAQQRPKINEINDFINTSTEILAQTLLHVDRIIEIQPASSLADEPWIFLKITTRDNEDNFLYKQSIPSSVFEEAQCLARENGASRIIIHGTNQGQLLVGLFAQYRYWTLTQARLLALDLLGNADHEAWLRGEES